MGDGPLNGSDPGGLDASTVAEFQVYIGGLVGAAVTAHGENEATIAWQDVQEAIDDDLPDVRPGLFQGAEQVKDIALRPLFTFLQQRLSFLANASALPNSCPGVAAETAENISKAAPGLDFDYVELKDVGEPFSTQPLTLKERILDAFGLWHPVEYTKNGYHVAVRVGTRIFDALTGPGGLPESEWLQRLGRTPGAILRTLPGTPR